MSENSSIEFKPTQLYIFQHNKTKLKYFGKTVQDLSRYKGSGVYWRKHLNKYGSDIKLLWSMWFYTEEEIRDFASLFSEWEDISNSKEWANMVDENGLDGNGLSKNNMIVFKYDDGSSCIISPSEYNANRDLYYTSSTGKISIFNKLTNKKERITTEEFHLNRDNYICYNENCVYVYDLNNNLVKITKDEFKANKILYKTATTNLVSVENILTNVTSMITTEEFYDNRQIYKTINANTTTIRADDGNTFRISLNDFDKNVHKHVNNNLVTVCLKYSKKYIQVTSEEYYENKHLYKTAMHKKMTVVEIATKIKKIITCDEYYENKHLYDIFSKGMVSCYLKGSDELIRVTKDEYNSNKHLYDHFNSAIRKGKNQCH